MSERRNQQFVVTVGRDARTVAVTAADTLEVYEQNVLVTSTGAYAITLPPVSEARGLMYSIYFVSDGGDVTIQDQDDSFDWSDMVMTANNDRVLLYSDGRTWHPLIDVTT